MYNSREARIGKMSRAWFTNRFGEQSAKREAKTQVKKPVTEMPQENFDEGAMRRVWVYSRFGVDES